MNNYRLDDSTESVYEYSSEQQAYVYTGSYYVYGINAQMSESEQLKGIQEHLKYATDCDGYDGVA